MNDKSFFLPSGLTLNSTINKKRRGSGLHSSLCIEKLTDPWNV